LVSDGGSGAPRPLVFTDEWAETDFTGAPMVESILWAFVGRCQECGERAERQFAGSLLVNPVTVDGTLYGDTYCLGCCADEPEGFVFVLPPLGGDTAYPEGGMD
jgi:hypothetical protein